MTNESARDEPGTPRVEQESSQVGEKGPAYGFWLATIALVLVSLVAFLPCLSSRMCSKTLRM
jgi:hypothetical protein